MFHKRLIVPPVPPAPALHSDQPPQSENQSETRMNQSETSQKPFRNQDEINTNAAAGGAASAAAPGFTTVFTVVSRDAAAEAAAPAAASEFKTYLMN